MICPVKFAKNWTRFNNITKKRQKLDTLLISNLPLSNKMLLTKSITTNIIIDKHNGIYN